MLFEVQLRRKPVYDHPLPVNHKRDSTGKDTHGPACSVQGGNGTVLIRQQDERQPVSGCKCLVRSCVVGTNPDDLGTCLLENFIMIPETAGLACTSIGFILRIEEKYDMLLACKIRQADGFSFLVRQGEIRCFGSNGYLHFHSLKVGKNNRARQKYDRSGDNRPGWLILA